MRQLILLLLLIVGIHTTADANRIPEIEEYYSRQTSEYLKTRFPDKPFTVFSKVYVADKTNDSRKKELKSKRNSEPEARLPYLGVDDYSEEVDLWSRVDLPLATLISQVDKVELKIRIDSSISDEEIAELKASISEQLKLVPQTDSVEFVKMDWTSKEVTTKRWWMTGGFLSALLVIFAMMYALSKLSVKFLIKGLEQPLSEIGKSSKAFANSALNAATDAQYQGSSEKEGDKEQQEDIPLGANLLELRNSGLELLQRNMDLLSKPDAETMEFIERQGADNPRAMGAILAELDNETLRSLFKFGLGLWWFVALSQPAPINQHSLRILNELDRLRLRRNFDLHNELAKDDTYREIGLVFGRLNVDQLKQVFSATKLEEAQTYFSILPRALALALGKSLYPGQWAIFLDDNKKKTIAYDAKKMQDYKDKAIALQPLRKEQEIQTFFRDLDLVRYLDTASFRDEKEFYLVLPEDSKIKKEREPYFKILETSADVIKVMGPDMNVKEWAYFLSSAEPHEKDKFLNSFANRLSYLIKEEEKRMDSTNLDITFLRNTKKKSMSAFLRAREVTEWKDSNETATEETEQESAA